MTNVLNVTLMKQLQEIVSTVLGRLVQTELSGYKTPLSALGLRSLQVVDLILSIEAKFDIAIPDESINERNFHSIYSIADLLDRLPDVVVLSR